MVGNSGGRGLVFLVIFRGNIAYLRCMCSLLTRVVLLPKTNRIESEIGSPFCSGSRLSKSSVVLAQQQRSGEGGEATAVHDSVDPETVSRILQWFLGNSAANSSHKKVRGIRSFYGYWKHKTGPFYTLCGEPILVSLSVGCQRIFQLFDSVLVVKVGELAFYLYKRAIGIIKQFFLHIKYIGHSL